MVKLLWPRVPREQIEKLRQVLRESLTASEETNVAVNAGGAHVVIARGQMAVTANAIRFLANDQTYFAVSFVADQSVDDMGADFFQSACPGDIGLLVEARLQLD